MKLTLATLAYTLMMTHGVQAQAAELATIMNSCPIMGLTIDINMFVKCTNLFKSYCTKYSQQTCHQMYEKWFSQPSTFRPIIQCAPWRSGVFSSTCTNAIASLLPASQPLARSLAGPGVFNNPTMAPCTTGNYPGLVCQSGLGVLAQNTLGQVTIETLNNKCVLDTLPSDNRVASDCAAYLASFCRSSTVNDCWATYAGIFYR
jgi:hypothetical protein